MEDIYFAHSVWEILLSSPAYYRRFCLKVSGDSVLVCRVVNMLDSWWDRERYHLNCQDCSAPGIIWWRSSTTFLSSYVTR